MEGKKEERNLWQSVTTSVSHWHFNAPQASVLAHVTMGSVVRKAQQRKRGKPPTEDRKSNQPSASSGDGKSHYRYTHCCPAMDRQTVLDVPHLPPK